MLKRRCGHAGGGASKGCGGQPDHPSVSHHIKSSRIIVYEAGMCTGYGCTGMELLNPINKLVTVPGSDKGREDTYTARMIFGWCNICMRVMDPAPHGSRIHG